MLVKVVQEGSAVGPLGPLLWRVAEAWMGRGSGNPRAARGPRRRGTRLHPPQLEAPWGPLEKASGGALCGQ